MSNRTNQQQQEYQHQQTYIQGYQPESIDTARVHPSIPSQGYRPGYGQGHQQPQFVYQQQHLSAYQQQGGPPHGPAGWTASNLPGGQYVGSSVPQQQYMSAMPPQAMIPMQPVPAGYPQPQIQQWQHHMPNYPGSSQPYNQFPAAMPHHQPQHPQQPNPAYTQQFVPNAYASGTRPQTGQLHSRAQFHPAAVSAVGLPPQQQFVPPQAGVGLDQQQPVQQQPPVQQQQELAAREQDTG